MSSNLIPQEWKRSELKGFCDVLSGNAFKSKDFVASGVPVVKISNVQYGEYIEKNQEYLPKSFLNDYSNYVVSENDLLIALTRPITNDQLKICRYPKESEQGLLNQRVAKLSPDKLLPESFILYQFRTEKFMKQVKSGLSETLQPNLSPKALAGFECVIPPLAEQKVIAVKLDMLLAKVDSIKGRLDAVPDTLKRFRQSVLAAAVSGKLTDEWRENRAGTINEVFASEKSLITFKEKTLGSLPKTWKWLRFDQVAGIASNLVDPNENKDSIHIAPNHIESWSGVAEGYQTVEQDGVKSAKHKFFKGQIVYSKIRPYLAKAIIAEFDGLCSADMYPINAKINTGYLFRWMMTSEFTDWASNAESRSVLPKINQKDLSKIPVPTPPLEEQTEIVRRVEKLFAYADKVEAKVNAAQERVNKLTQSILAKAFRGELTAKWREQNPDLISGENSAEALLEKIKAEREKLKPKKKTRKRKNSKEG